MRRVNEAVKQVLSEAIPTLKDPRIGFVTVTTVETTSDLDHAKVWVSVLEARASERGRSGRSTALPASSRAGSGRSSACDGRLGWSSSTIARSSMASA